MPAAIGDGGDDGGGDEGGGGKMRNALLAAIQKGKKLKKVDEGDEKGKGRRNTIANPKSSAWDSGPGGDLMSALKERMNLRRKGISGARKDEEEGASKTGDVPRPPGPPKSMSMPAVLPSQAVEEGEVPDAPISMKGMASALKAAASNRDLLGEEQDDGDWSD